MKPGRNEEFPSPRLRIETIRKGASGTATIAGGGSSFLVNLDTLATLGLGTNRLEPGMELDETEVSLLALAAEAREAEKRALALLARAEQSTFLLRCKLEQRGYSSRASSIALERLSASLLLDDKRFARAYAASRLAHRGSRAEGPASILRSLREKGIDRSTAIQTITELLGSEAEPEAREQALAAAAAKVLKRSGGDRDEARRFLRELGYKSEEISLYFENLDDSAAKYHSIE
jgi:SOS response regulatory protein OraA/RecX